MKIEEVILGIKKTSIGLIEFGPGAVWTKFNYSTNIEIAW